MFKSLNRGVSAPIAIIIIVVCVVLTGLLAWQYRPISEIKIPPPMPSEKLPEDKIAEKKWKEYVLEEISEDSKSPDFYDRRLIGIQENGQRDIIVSSLKGAIGESKEDITWYPRKVSFPSYSSKIFFVKQLSETAHSKGLIMFDIKTLTFKELTETGKIYQNYYNYKSIVSSDGLKIASLGYGELYLLDLLTDEAKLLVKASEGEAFYPAKKVPGFVWLDDHIIQYPVYSVEKIYDLPIEVRQISTIEDQTADWGTYRNEEYGFEVKYLGEWKIEKEYFTGAITVAEYKDHNVEIVSPYGSTVKITSSKQFLGGKGISLILKEEREVVVGTILVTEKIWVDENNLLIFANTSCFGKLGEVITVEDSERSKNIFKYSTEITLKGEKTDRENDLKSFNRMLSTFRFLE